LLDHLDWAEDLMSHFSWGQSFLDINETLLEKYAACTDAAEVKEVETQWLDDLEKEYQAKRAPATGDNQDDNWVQGNVNRLQNLNISDDESGDQSQEDEDAEDDEDVQYDKFGNTIPKIPAQIKIPVEPTADNEDEEEEDNEQEQQQEEAEKVRQKILHSQPFQNPTPTSKRSTSNTNTSNTSYNRDLSDGDYQSDESNSNSDDDEEVEEDDGIYNALPETPQGKSSHHSKSKKSNSHQQRRKGGATVSAVFSSSYVSAPSHPR